MVSTSTWIDYVFNQMTISPVFISKSLFYYFIFKLCVGICVAHLLIWILSLSITTLTYMCTYISGHLS